MSEYSERHSRHGDKKEALPSRCDTLRIGVSHVAANASAFLVHTVALLLCKLLITLATELASSELVYHEDSLLRVSFQACAEGAPAIC